MSQNMSDDNSSENTCVVCFKNVDIHSIGDCDHPVCYECSTRMRVLCRQNECPICRHDMQKVIFTKTVKAFKELDKSIGFRPLMDRKFKIVFENVEVQEAYNTLLAHVCSKCPGRHAFQTFINLRDHMRKEHELFYCDLCVFNLKILTHERRCYTRKELATHRRQGDSDNRSHRGHPLCEFCNERYMDNDELFRHLRRDHLFCHFCDADGLHQYYDSYDVLRTHFKDKHYLCEEGDCYDEKFTSAFRTDIDLKAHRASVHGRQLSKAAAKQARTLELEFTLKPRPRQGDRRGPNRGLRNHNYSDEEEGAVGGLPVDHHRSAPFFRPPPAFTTSSEEFPSLGGSAAAPLNQAIHYPKKGQSSGRGSLRQEDFPALGPDVTTASVSVRMNSMSAADRTKGAKPANLSIYVNHRPGSMEATVSSRTPKEAFPSLQSSYSTVSSKAPPPLPTKVAETKSVPKNKPVSALDDSSRKQRVLRLFNTNLSDDEVSSRNSYPALSANVPSHISSLASSQWSSGREPEPKVLVNKTKINQPPPKPPQPKTFHIEDDFPSLNSRFDASCSFAPERKPPEVKAKKESSISIAVDNDWIKINQLPASTDNVSSDSDISSSKKGSKKNKNKSKPQKEVDELSSSTSSKKANNNNNNEVGKKINNNNEFTKKANHNNNEVGKKNKQKEVPKSKTKHMKVEEELSQPNQESSQSKKPKEKERKRSELKIDSLNDETKSNNTNLNEFPNLSNGSTSRLPPGFTQAPPGFESTPTGPPPGFSITLNSVARPSNGLTFTSSSGQNYSIPTAETQNSSRVFCYVPPPNVKHRNTTLVSRVTEALQSQTALEQFLQMSAMYRQGSLTAEDYYCHCRKTMGSDVFTQIFPELLVLLPDIAKQQDLWRVAERPSQWKLDVCAACGQVMMTGDLKHHLAAHSLENHFPALSSDLAAALPNAWANQK